MQVKRCALAPNISVQMPFINSYIHSFILNQPRQNLLYIQTFNRKNSFSFAQNTVLVNALWISPRF